MIKKGNREVKKVKLTKEMIEVKKKWSKAIMETKKAKAKELALLKKFKQVAKGVDMKLSGIQWDAYWDNTSTSQLKKDK